MATLSSSGCVLRGSDGPNDPFDDIIESASPNTSHTAIAQMDTSTGSIGTASQHRPPRSPPPTLQLSSSSVVVAAPSSTGNNGGGGDETPTPATTSAMGATMLIGAALGALGMPSISPPPSTGDDTTTAGRGGSTAGGGHQDSKGSSTSRLKKYIRYGLSVVLLLFAAGSACYRYIQNGGSA
jgi:hypothetical protein